MSKLLRIAVLLLSVIGMTLGGCIRIEKSDSSPQEPEYRYESSSY